MPQACAFLQVSMKMAEGGDVDALMTRMDILQSELDAVEGWEIDRQLDRAMDALRCPPGTTPARCIPLLSERLQASREGEGISLPRALGRLLRSPVVQEMPQ